MATIRTTGARIAGVCSCIPKLRFDNLSDTVEFTREEIQKVTRMAGVSARRMAGDHLCSSDLCAAAGRRVMTSLNWDPASVDALIFVTQTPDYFLPSTACVVHSRLGLMDHCAAFDVGLGCSGYPYGLWLGAMMIQSGGVRRVLVMHGETPTRFVDKSDRSVSLLFGDAGSATALEAADSASSSPWHFAMHTDGSAFASMIIESGGFRDRFNPDSKKHSVAMDGALIFNFTIKRVPALIQETLDFAGVLQDSIDYYIFHQSNEYIIKHLCAKQSLPLSKVPIILKEFGNTGGASIPLTLTEANFERPADRRLRLMLLGYGVGLSWGSALVDLEAGVPLETVEFDNVEEKVA